MNLRNNSGTEIGTSGNPLVVGDGSGAMNVIVDSGTISINQTTTANDVDATVANFPTTASTSAISVRCVNTAGNAFETCGGTGGSGGTSSNFGSAFPTPGTAAGFTDGTNMVAGRVVTSTPSSGDAGLVVRPINPNLAADNSTLSTAKVPVIAGTVSTSAPTWTNGNQSALSLQTDGSVRAAITNTPTVTANAGTGSFTVAQTTAANLNVRPDTSGATGAAPPARANFAGGLQSGATGGFLGGFAVCDSFVNVNVSTATTTALITGVSGRHVRICGMSLVTAAANNVALISGTGATCGTGTTGMNGGTTAASGWNFAANGGLTQGNGLGTVNQTNATGDSVCIITSAATQLSGRIAYAIY
jgi:hypothetical protein